MSIIQSVVARAVGDTSMADEDVRIRGEVAGVPGSWLADRKFDAIADDWLSAQRRGRSGITPRWERRGVALTLPCCARRDHPGGPDAGGPE